MAKYHGVIGYRTGVQKINGVVAENIEERSYFGDVVRETATESMNGVINPTISVGNTISILADPYAYNHFTDIRYFTWHGVKWTVAHVEVQRPRLILRPGGKYNGT